MEFAVGKLSIICDYPLKRDGVSQKEFYMKKRTRVFGIIAISAIIGITMGKRLKLQAL